MIYYRSDWPEVGLSTALNKWSLLGLTDRFNNDHDWVHDARRHGATLRWIADQNEFESGLYGLPIWDLYLEVEDIDGSVLTGRLDSTILQEVLGDGVRQLLDVPPWGGDAYVSSKLVKDEPLYDALIQVGFEEVEHRCIYICKIRDLSIKPSTSSTDNIWITSLSAIDPKHLSSYREQILNMCHEAFTKGHSRHYTDMVLLEQLPGIAYILAAMELNFRHVLPENFLVAVDVDSDQLCGFSVIGKKPGLLTNVYTQLLSAVGKMYRGQGVYGSLTNLLSQTLPQDASLLNITQIGNRAMQRAYHDSGRVHLADTVVLRRVFYAGG